MGRSLEIALHRAAPLSTTKKEALAARTPLVLQVMKLLGSLDRDSFRASLESLNPQESRRGFKFPN
jgi:brefeldin A-inhibited guanine nucleotide-exchange protein